MSSNLKIAKFNSSVLPYRIVTDTTLTNDPIIDVTQGSGTIYEVHVTVAAGNNYYLKLFLQTASIALGTTPPDVVIKTDASSTTRMSFPGGLPYTALSAVIVDGAADNSSAKTGSGAVDITIVTS
jgi:hypothetical protein